MSDRKRYLLNYVMSGASYAADFLSLFVIVPKITGAVSPQVYGTFCAIFGYTFMLSHADLGFTGAASKFACDEFVRGNQEKEIELLSAAAFLQFLGYVVVALILLAFAADPHIVISGLNQETAAIIRRLFILLAVFSLASIPNGILGAISGFRIEGYRLASWQLLSGMIGLASVFVIFGPGGSHSVVRYYLLTNLVSIGTTFLVGYHLLRKWNYPVRAFLRAFRFNKEALALLWPLARVSLFSSLAWIAYYEMDNVFIGKFISVQALAFYAIAASGMSFFRRLNVTLLGPYPPVYNRFYVNNDDAGMRSFYLSNVAVTAPFIFIPAVVAIIFMPQFIVAWVGVKYAPSIDAARLLVGCWMLAPVMDLPCNILRAKLVLRPIYVLGILDVVVFWGTVGLLVGPYGLASVAFGKAATKWIDGSVCVYLGNRLVRLDAREYASKILAPLLLTLLVILCLCHPFVGMATVKSKGVLLKLLAIEGGICAVALASYAAFSRQFRRAVGEEYFVFRNIRSRLASAFGGAASRLSARLR